MSTLVQGVVKALFLGIPGESLVKQERDFLQAEMDGFLGDRHASFKRTAWGAGDKQRKGTVRRNERHWSAVSQAELESMSQEMDLSEVLNAGSIGANLCFAGLPSFSFIPKGSTFKFPSGAELLVEEYNPPCLDMGKELASKYLTNSGIPIRDTAFAKAAQHSRGLVGVVEVPGLIKVGDEIEVFIYKPPDWMQSHENPWVAR